MWIWQKVASLSDVVEGSFYPCTVGGQEVVLVRNREKISCFSDRCTHQPIRLSKFAHLADGQIYCNAHGARFDSESGDVICQPAQRALMRFETKVEQGQVFVLFEESID